MTPAWVLDIAIQWGETCLIHSTEEHPDSVWIDDERGYAGPDYYEKRLVPMAHRWSEHGLECAFVFTRDGVRYSIRGGEEKIQEVFTTLLRWVDDGVLDSFSEAFSLFTDEGEAGNEWWRVLRLPLDATREEIERGYKLMAQKTHPDWGGSHEAFLKVRKAYEEALNERHPFS